MWNAMIQHIINAGYEVNVYNRTKSKTDNLIKMWACYRESIAELSQESDIIISIIWDPKSVEETYFWPNWVLKNIKQGSIVIDMTTTKPSLAKKIYQKAQMLWCESLDAPVSGWDIGAINATLSIMVWWTKEAYNEALSLFQLMGKSINHVWGSWAGQDMKMANQIGIAWNTIWMVESLFYAEKVGLNLETTVEVLCAWGASSWWYQNLASRILKGDFESYFYIKHFVKDMWIALEECNAMNISLPWLDLVKSLYDSMMEKWEGDLWMQSLIKEIKRINNS